MKIHLSAREVMVLIDEMTNNIKEYERKGYCHAVRQLKSKQFRTPDHGALRRQIEASDMPLHNKIKKQPAEKPAKEKKTEQIDTVTAVALAEQMDRIEGKLDKLIKLWDL